MMVQSSFWIDVRVLRFVRGFGLLVFGRRSWDRLEYIPLFRRRISRYWGIVTLFHREGGDYCAVIRD